MSTTGVGGWIWGTESDYPGQDYPLYAAVSTTGVGGWVWGTESDYPGQDYPLYVLFQQTVSQ